MTLLRTQLGNTLRGHRLRQRRTLRDVSGVARVSLGYLSEVERGQKEASSDVAGVTLGSLWEGEGGKRKAPPEPLASICAALEVDLAALLAEVSLGLRGIAATAVRPLVAPPAAEPQPAEEQPAAAVPEP